MNSEKLKIVESYLEKEFGEQFKLNGFLVDKGETSFKFSSDKNSLMKSMSITSEEAKEFIDYCKDKNEI